MTTLGTRHGEQKEIRIDQTFKDNLRNRTTILEIMKKQPQLDVSKSKLETINENLT